MVDRKFLRMKKVATTRNPVKVHPMVSSTTKAAPNCLRLPFQNPARVRAKLLPRKAETEARSKTFDCRNRVRALPMLSSTPKGVPNCLHSPRPSRVRALPNRLRCTTAAPNCLYLRLPSRVRVRPTTLRRTMAAPSCLRFPFRIRVRARMLCRLSNPALCQARLLHPLPPNAKIALMVP